MFIGIMQVKRAQDLVAQESTMGVATPSTAASCPRPPKKVLEFQQFRRETGKTGGGPAPRERTTASRAVNDVLEEQPSFSGLHGFEAAVGEWCQVM